MKKILSIFLLASLCICSFAQNSLKGIWTMSESFMGIKMTCEETFSDANSGKVIDKSVIVIDFGMMGVKVNGQYDGYIEGTFQYNGSQLEINWDASAMKLVATKPITVSTSGKKEASDLKKELEKTLVETVEEAIEEIRKEMNNSSKEVYNSVEFKGDKLILESVNDKGKKEVNKLTRKQ